MTDFKKITEMLALSCSQREIQRECNTSPKTIVKVRKALESSGKAFSEILQLSEEDLCSMISTTRPRKPRQCVCKEPDFSKVSMALLKGGTIKSAWTSYCKEAVTAGQRPLKYAAYCAAVKASGVSTMISDASHFKSGFLVFAKTKHMVQIGKETWQICFAVFPLSRKTFFGLHSSTDKGPPVNVLQDIFRDAGGVPPYIHLYKGDAGSNEAMLEMLTYYGASSIGWELKGISAVVEDVSTYINRRLSDCEFTSEDNAKEYFDLMQAEYNERISYMCRSRNELYAELDCKELYPLPQHRYEQVEEKSAKIQFDYHVTYKKVRYSVPPEAYLESTDVILCISSNRIEIVSKTGVLLAEHPHFPDNEFRYSTLPEHKRTSAELAKLPWNASVFCNWAKRRFGDDTASMIKGIIDGHEIEQQAYSQCYWLLKLGEKKYKEGKATEFIEACQKQRHSSPNHAYYAVKKQLGEG